MKRIESKIYKNELSKRQFEQNFDVAPTIINTFLDKYDFSGKTSVLFATSGGSGFGKTVDELKGSVAADTVIREGTLLNGRNSVAKLKSWVESLGI